MAEYGTDGGEREVPPERTQLAFLYILDHQTMTIIIRCMNHSDGLIDKKGRRTQKDIRVFTHMLLPNELTVEGLSVRLQSFAYESERDDFSLCFFRSRYTRFRSSCRTALCL